MLLVFAMLNIALDQFDAFSCLLASSGLFLPGLCAWLFPFGLFLVFLWRISRVVLDEALTSVSFAHKESSTLLMVYVCALVCFCSYRSRNINSAPVCSIPLTTSTQTTSYRPWRQRRSGSPQEMSSTVPL